MSTLKNLQAICELIQDDEMRDDVMIKSDQPLCKYFKTCYFQANSFYRGRN